MREIKFRIWDVENKEMLNVQELDFEPTFYGGRIAIRPDQYNDYFDTEDMILMQYTGLHDKNGKEIYEGDIVNAKYKKVEITGIVKYDADYCEYRIYNKNETEYMYLWKNINLEVIGNAYDNPELLKEEIC